MKLFIRDHLLLMTVHLLQFITIAGILYLAGYRNFYLLGYTFLLCVVFLVGYLFVKYNMNKKFYVRLSTPIQSADEALQQLDNTELARQLAHLLRSQYNDYEQRVIRLEAKQEEHLLFIDRWIHQMKTPLSVIELMAADLDEPISSNMREETDRMKRELNTVLHMARIRTFEQDFHIKQVNLSNLIQEVLQENKRLFIRHKIYPNVQISDDLRTVATDEKWLYFIVIQMIHNAVKYSASHADKICINIQQNNAKTTLTIQDFGVGIPKEDLSRIFNPFYTGVNGRTFRESTGVGLYLVSEVVNVLGHQIEVESTVNEGTTMHIMFTE